MKNNFYAHIPSIKEKINNGLITQKIFTVNPGKVRAKYFIIGIVFIIASLAISGVAIPFLGVLGVQFIFAGVTSGIMTMIFGYFMPQKTVRGVEEMEKILGFKEFIKTAETDRLKFIQENDIGSDLTGQLKMFEYLLPYAIMLGVGEKWAGMFKDIYAEVGQNPAWYSGYDAANFNALRLTDRMNSIRSTATSAMTSSPSASSGGSSFGGGGFSGGGFGGGGVGSW